MTKERIEVDFLERYAIKTEENQPYRFTKDLKSLFENAQKNPETQYVINPMQIILLDPKDKDTDKAVLRIMHLLAQAQQGKLPANVEIVGLDKACHILNESIISSKQNNRITQTTHAYLSANLRSETGEAVKHSEKDNAMREQFRIVERWAKKFDPKKSPLSIRSVNGKMIETREDSSPKRRSTLS
jgi:hypothetical protein